jgi:hypothetical protein
VGEEDPAATAEALRTSGVERILSGALRDDFLIGPGPSAALLDAQGFLVARGAIQHRRNLEALLSSVHAPADPGSCASAREPC